ncbi:MAG: hypothetical protein QOI80_354, partial [Solirubrobacteraceae bacterium]|nr:hypothetical protein [Solirubrobacteraceae bacterium]
SGTSADSAPAAGGLSIRTTPALDPGYSASVPDYTLRCTAGKPVTVSAQVPSGQTLALDGGPAESGSVSKSIALSPGQAFKLTVSDADGRDATHYVRCAPRDLPAWRVERRGTPVSRWIAFSPTEREKPPRGAPYSVIADSHGVPVWWARAEGATPLDTTVLPDGTVAWARLGGPFSQTYWDHTKLDGSALPPLNTVGEGADHHDLQVLPNGNHLMIAYRPRDHVDLRRVGGPRDAAVYDGEVQELTPDGKLVWSWSSKGHVNLRETPAWRFRSTDQRYKGRPAFDLIHMNSVEYDGPNLLISAKNVNAVYLVRRSDGRILWKLGGTSRPESLTIKRDPYGSKVFGAQHDARMHGDGTVSLHDNATFRHGQVPRIVRYRIDTRARTATLVQRFTRKRVRESYCCGSAQRLSGGHWLIDWGANPLIEEVRGDGSRVLALTMPRRLFSYKAHAVEPGVLTRDALRAGMDAQYPR